MKTGVHKKLSCLLVVCMVAMLFPINASAYSDTKGHWAEKAIDKWSELEIVQGNNNAFRPDDNITRGEMAVIIDNIMKYQKKSSEYKFDDLGNDFYTDPILKANAAGIILGDGLKVRPRDILTREEGTVMLARAFGVEESSTCNLTFSDSASISFWAKGYVNAMTNLGYIQGCDNKFSPKDNMTRAAVITILDNAIKEIYSEAGEYSSDVNGIAVINTKGVVLKDSTIDGNLIISEGVGSGDVTLDNVKVTGKAIVRGGGKDSIHINGDSQIEDIVLDKDAPDTISQLAWQYVVHQIRHNDNKELEIVGANINKLKLVHKYKPAIGKRAEIYSLDYKLFTRKDRLVGYITGSTECSTYLFIANNESIPQIIGVEDYEDIQSYGGFDETAKKLITDNKILDFARHSDKGDELFSQEEIDSAIDTAKKDFEKYSNEAFLINLWYNKENCLAGIENSKYDELFGISDAVKRGDFILLNYEIYMLCPSVELKRYQTISLIRDSKDSSWRVVSKGCSSFELPNE